MNSCLFCGKDVKNKFCNISCKNRYYNKKIFTKKRICITCICEKCHSTFSQIIIKDGKSYIKKHCSRKCANSKNITDATKEKIRNSLKKDIQLVTLICKECTKEFIINKKKKNQKFCSRKCSLINTNRIRGRKSAQNRVLRSKNEIYFSKLCQNRFKTVRTNVNIFNGWDADVVIDDIKYAILWNGKWHYEKITKNIQ